VAIRRRVTAQLLEAGLSAQLIKRRLERGRWQQLHWGVYAAFTGPPPRTAWLWAAVLRAGPGAVLSHLTAAELHGLTDSQAEAIFVTVPATRRIAAPEIIVRTSSRIAEARQPNREPPRTSVEETVLDLAQLAWTFDDACGWLTQACGRRLTTAAKLEQAQQLRKKMRERAHGLPRSRHQVRVVIEGKTVYRDAYYEKYKLATELDGKLAHPDQERWRDNHRDNQAGAHGILTTRYGWRAVYGDPCKTALLEARILQKRGWTGRPRPCSPACPGGTGMVLVIDLRSLPRSRQPLREAPRLTKRGSAKAGRRASFNARKPRKPRTPPGATSSTDGRHRRAHCRLPGAGRPGQLRRHRR
jgi:predicted transcriptional regulator of viral defense system